MNSASTSTSTRHGAFDGVRIVQTYLKDMIASCRGMKVLLLDPTTTQIVSAVYSQSDILDQAVYLVSNLLQQTPNDDHSHLSAVVFVRPTFANMEALCHELNVPKYKSYYLFFSNMVPPDYLQKLAQADVQERVVKVQECYADFLPVNSDVWTLQVRHSVSMTVSAGTSYAPKHADLYERHLNGLSSMLLSLKRRPCSIRYAKHSPCAEELAHDVLESIQSSDRFSVRENNTLVLILDRRDDPITPLLSQWTYQAMVHELLGLNNQRVSLKGAPNIAKDLEEVVLNHQDSFFESSKHKNFGELGEEIQTLLQNYQKQTAVHNSENLNSIEDMQNFMDKFPELRSQSHVVSKHVAIMGELARLVETAHLMDVSQFEQNLACSDDHTSHWRELLEKLSSKHIKIPDKLRLGLLYSLRYEASANLHMVQQAMSKGGVPADLVNLIPILLRYAGQTSRSPGLLFGNQTTLSKFTKNIVGVVQGIENVYAQHVPLVMDTIISATRGKLSPREYPSVTKATAAIPDEILVYMVGGITYEEGTKVAEFNETSKIPVILAGSTIHNSTSFLDEVKATSSP